MNRLTNLLKREHRINNSFSSFSVNPLFSHVKHHFRVDTRFIRENSQARDTVFRSICFVFAKLRHCSRTHTLQFISMVQPSRSEAEYRDTYIVFALYTSTVVPLDNVEQPLNLRLNIYFDCHIYILVVVRVTARRERKCRRKGFRKKTRVKVLAARLWSNFTKILPIPFYIIAILRKKQYACSQCFVAIGCFVHAISQ